MADTRNPREVVDIGKFTPYDHPVYGPGAIREVEYIDGTIERRFFYHGTEREGEGAPDSGYLVDTKVNPETREAWNRGRPPASAEGVKEGDTRGPQDKPKREVFRGGRWVTEDNPVYQPDKPANGTVVERTDGTYIIKPDGSATKVQGVPPPDAPKGTLTEREDGTYLVSPDGKTATRVTGLPPKTQDKYTQVAQDKDTGRWWGLTRAGTWEQMQGGPGAPAEGRRPSGPSLPQIIVGHSHEALRRYGDELRQSVANGTMTAAEASNRWKEARETAEVAVNEATILQRQQESNLNASVNLANSRLSASSSGFNTALQVVNNLNDKLPKGSRLGGEAFAAFLGVQLAHAQRMGAYDNIVPGSQQSMEGRNISEAAQGATATFNQQVDRLTRPPAAPALPAAGDVTPPAVPTAPPAIPGTPSPVGDTGAPPVPVPSAPTYGEDTQRILNNVRPMPGGTPIDSVPQASAQPDFAVLSAMQSQAPPVVPLNPAPSISPEPALLYTQAASTPFWRMTDQEIEQYRAAGVPDDVIRSSGRMVA